MMPRAEGRRAPSTGRQSTRRPETQTEAQQPEEAVSGNLLPPAPAQEYSLNLSINHSINQQGLSIRIWVRNQNSFPPGFLPIVKFEFPEGTNLRHGSLIADVRRFDDRSETAFSSPENGAVGVVEMPAVHLRLTMGEWPHSGLGQLPGHQAGTTVEASQTSEQMTEYQARQNSMLNQRNKLRPHEFERQVGNGNDGSKVKKEDEDNEEGEFLVCSPNPFPLIDQLRGSLRKRKRSTPSRKLIQSSPEL